jgi:hypothetical protein
MLKLINVECSGLQAMQVVVRMYVNGRHVIDTDARAV